MALTSFGFPHPGALSGQLQFGSTMKSLTSVISTTIAGVYHVEPSISFLLGDRQYLARPLGIPAQWASGATQFTPVPTRTPMKSRITQLWKKCAQPKSVLHIVDKDAGDPLPITCFKASKNQTVDAESLLTWRSEILDSDDVFHPDFLEEVFFSGVESGDMHLTGDARALLAQWGTRKVGYGSDFEIVNGPYLIQDGIFHSVWRVYEDTRLAFSQALWPVSNDTSSFTQINAPGNPYRGHRIAVPSRANAGFSGTLRKSAIAVNGEDGPLRGMRLAVKDNFHVSGTKTTLGNRAYLETYPTQRTNAPVITKLLRAGAQLVGKTHLSSFAMMEHPTQSVDFQAPFNPRGDGYLIPGGSSSGSAAAMAAYPWLDIAICADTTGSSRIPAFQTGLFGFRPSTNLISGKGLVNAWEGMDTPAWIGRDLKTLPSILHVLAEPVHTQTNRLSRARVLYLTDFELSDSFEQVEAMEKLLCDIDGISGQEHQKVSVQDDWGKASPVEETDLHKYLSELTHYGWFYSAFHSFDLFRKEYKSIHGFEPFVTEVVRWYWQMGSKVTETEHEELMHRLGVFREWFLKQYLADGRTIIAMHIDKVQPKYRDQYPGDNDPNVPGLRPTFLSAILGALELAVPISELPYQSLITGREEKLPVVVSFMGNVGANLDVLQWAINALEKTRRATNVQTGKTMF